MSALADLMATPQSPNVEVRQPKPGLRHNQSELLVYHRFPIKGGLTSTQVLTRMIEQSNPLFTHLKKHSRIKSAEEVARERMHRRRTRALRT